ncbi:hypothetical protein, partial [Bacillus toyonensis]|uniref:hypothetical protein n=1 Tax=Bacillus toyonensis TaxID=155322 RepID=UPI002DBACA91
KISFLSFIHIAAVPIHLSINIPPLLKFAFFFIFPLKKEEKNKTVTKEYINFIGSPFLEIKNGRMKL